MSPDDGVLYTRTFPDGRRYDVIELTYGRGRVVLVNADCQFCYDDSW